MIIDKLLILSAALEDETGNKNFKLVLNKEQFKKVCIKMEGLVWDENGSFDIDIENCKLVKCFGKDDDVCIIIWE